MPKVDRWDKVAKSKNNRGNPIKYKKRYCKDVIEFMSKGKSLVAFLATIEVTEQVFHQWRQKYKELEEAVNIGKQRNQQWFEELLMAHVTGANKSPKANSDGKYLAHSNAGLLKWAMSKRFRDYREVTVEEPRAKNVEVVYRSYVNEEGMVVAEREEVKLDE